jgi:cytoskeletal protein CcmA (bactofilin family)
LIAWPFIAFSIVFMALVCAHFFLAYRAWQTSRGEEFSDIDPDYVRMEDYFARSFRSKVTEWLQLPVQATEPDGTGVIQKGTEQIRISGQLEHAQRCRKDDIQVVQGDFRCGARCTFTREIYAYEDAFIGAGTRLQSIAVDGNLVLGPGVRVTRWADSAGEMEIGPNSVVGARATARKSIHLGKGAQVGSVYAPVVSTSLKRTSREEQSPESQPPALEFPAPASGGDSIRGRGDLRMDPKRLSPLGAGCWLYEGDLTPSAAIWLKAKLVVKGDCLLPAGSVLEGDVKADGQILVGERSICKGNMIAGGDIWLGPSCRFQGVVHAGTSLRLSRGVRGGTADAPVAVFAAETLSVEEDVMVHGKLASAGRVVALTDSRGRNQERLAANQADKTRSRDTRGAGRVHELLLPLSPGIS